ncbi:MAG: tetratricopeptide repeat protein [Opitutaceae bacterium]|nr:tetratricopeptide repeat protein [Opitutaceae bacterium]
MPEAPRELLRLNDEMREFFAGRVRRRGGPEARVDDIVAAILSEEGMHFAYESDGLYDVREAFRRRRGNCVTFAMLVVAVAREYRVPARFNEVEIRPHWSRTGGLVLESRHLNVRVETETGSFEIDLQLFANVRATRRSANSVSDARAFAGLYSNAGVYRLADGERAGALELLERAVAIDPTFSSGWSNLGAACLLAGEVERARICYERALAEKNDSMAAISGLARIHRDAGRIEESARLERAAARYRERNPYYLFALAREERASGSLEAARGHLARAIRIKNDEPEFYELIVQVSRELGRARDAERWTRRLEGLRPEMVALSQRRVAPSAGPTLARR